MTPEEEIKSILMKLLNSIQQGDIETYKKLVSEDLTCFEPETNGFMVTGLDFHLFLMGKSNPAKNYQLELINPVFKVFNTFAFTSYTLLISKLVNDEIKINSVNETRIFKKENVWKMIHFHRS